MTGDCPRGIPFRLLLDVMSWPQTAMPAATTTAMGEEPYLPVEEVAQRLDLPLGILLRRVEAGDVPSRREENADGVHYLVRLGDLGIESPVGDVATALAPPPPPPDAVNHQ